jgi:hypothetical protein
MWQKNGNTNKWCHSLRPAVEAMVRLVNVAGSVPCRSCQGPRLTAILHPHVVSTFSRAFSPLTPCETKLIYRNLLVGTFLLIEQEYCAADSNLETRQSENTCCWTPLVFLSTKFCSIPSWAPGSHVWVCAENNAQFLQDKPSQDEQDPSENSAPLHGSASACNDMYLLLVSTQVFNMQPYCYDVYSWPSFNIQDLGHKNRL